MPLRPVDAKRVLVRRDRCIEDIESFALHRGLDLPPLAVETIELCCQRHGITLVRSEQAGDADRHIGQTPGCVQSGSDHETQVVRACPRGVSAGGGEQGAHARLHASRTNALQALADEDAVGAVELHDVGDCAQRDQVQEPCEIGLGFPEETSVLPQLRAQRDEHVVHHAHAGEMPARERATGLVGIDDQIGCGQLQAGQVMIGDQHFDAARARRSHPLDAGDTIVERDVQRLSSSHGVI